MLSDVSVLHFILRLNNTPFCGYSTFVYSFISWGTFGLEHLLTSFCMNICFQFSGVVIAGPYVKAFDEELVDYFPKWLHQFKFLPEVCEDSSFCTSWSTLVTVFYDNHPRVCEVASHCILICSSLRASDVEHIFIYLLAISVTSSEKYLFRSFAH